jgi:hypothetical protein
MIRVLLILFLVCTPAIAKDLGQWQHQAPDISDYFKSLKQPDLTVSSCCGEADAYYADKTETGSDGELYAIITDTRPDEPLKRPHKDVGTKVLVPTYKMRKVPIFNPTEHTIIFLGRNNFVYCYEPVTLM